jgi:hypothetical protein
MLSQDLISQLSNNLPDIFRGVLEIHEDDISNRITLFKVQ